MNPAMGMEQRSETSIARPVSVKEWTSRSTGVDEACGGPNEAKEAMHLRRKRRASSVTSATRTLPPSSRPLPPPPPPPVRKGGCKMMARPVECRSSTVPSAP
eukprot:2285445-Pleurochrysis_carterae.AAC.1